jgi:acetyl esterase/lipase
LVFQVADHDRHGRINRLNASPKFRANATGLILTDPTHSRCLLGFLPVFLTHSSLQRIFRKASEWFWTSYSGGRVIDRDPYATPLHATTLSDLPPVLVILAGCDALRDEGRAYSQRLREAGVETEEVCYSRQPHGFINFGFPVAEDAYETIGRWTRSHLALASE